MVLFLFPHRHIILMLAECHFTFPTDEQHPKGEPGLRLLRGDTRQPHPGFAKLGLSEAPRARASEEVGSKETPGWVEKPYGDSHRNMLRFPGRALKKKLGFLSCADLIKIPLILLSHLKGITYLNSPTCHIRECFNDV